MLALLKSLFRLPRWQKRLIQLFVDAVLLTASFFLAQWLRLESWAPLTSMATWSLWLAVLPISLGIFVRLGFYRSVVRYVNVRALQSLVIGIASSAGLLLLGAAQFSVFLPRSTCLIYAMLAIFSVGGVRFMLRAMHMHSQMRYKTRVIVYGAGSAGAQLVRSLDQGSEYIPVAFIDDWRGMDGTFVEGLKVYGPDALPRLVTNYGVNRILLAIPSATRARRQAILRMLKPLQIPVQTLPSIEDVIDGRAQLNEIRDVTVEDLLGRDPVPPNQALMDANIRGKVVMVTGAGGSIGSELCRQVLQQGPTRLLLYEINEYSLYTIEHELQQRIEEQRLAVSVKALLGSVQDRERLDSVMRVFGVDTIYHAAAYKHVPLVEYNSIPGILNNVFGTLATAQAAIDGGVETFVLVSTDKAVRPTNVMGTTKRLAELCCQALAEQQSTTRFTMVRFGNVLGSSGSVVPLFHAQIARGGPVTVTHSEVTRYFMTIPEAAQLVIQAGAMGTGGDVFVLDMGAPVKIADLAAEMIRLSGLEVRQKENPQGDIEIRFTGLRPGEKLYEELLIGKNVVDTEHPRIMSAKETYWPWARLEAYLQRLQQALQMRQHKQIRQLLLEAPTDYAPQGDIVDLEWLEAPATTRPKAPIASHYFPPQATRDDALQGSDPSTNTFVNRSA
ncbi:polysaccharide biosynthesis protein [Halomonas daqingensis]|uniref:Polysaccharide biosynthesis protein n=1 Tax=Billgrantia desiderata TaxID=52021 RepID=A0AAW4YYC3_9GAMM|nr:nucleoside-diphosphate sugar epimerase/dehydratase [Halomonas desiderata]MCE8029522.1 polysaccharide biosynthesis protein [Halomonas desiderata]MCE8052946.1 polysaccharide biosynthesis protein [Halomonas desiderata]OUE45227.1 nucleoside-diphosphate sugar epimerase [Halomonas desiderata SP1]